MSLFMLFYYVRYYIAVHVLVYYDSPLVGTLY